MKKVWKIVKNKYFIATAIFVVVIAFIDENNLMVSYRLRHQVSTLEKERAELMEGMEKDSINAQRLKDDKDAIERFGREHYYMKRDNEDVYIITTDE